MNNKTLRSVYGGVVLIIIWSILTDTGTVSKILLPSPQSVGSELFHLFQIGSFATDIMTSLEEFGLGFFLGVALGLTVGVAVSQSRRARVLIMPSVQLLRFVVPFSLIPLATAWFGFSIYGKVFIVAWAVTFVMVVATYGAIDNLDPLIRKAGRMMGFHGFALAVRIILPGAAGDILSGVRVAIGIGWISVIAAEYLGSTAGLGWLITNAQANLDSKEILAGMAVIGVLGASMSWLTRLGSRLIVRM